MTNYAVIGSGGKQYKVQTGDIVLVDKLDVPKGKSYVFPQVYLVRNGDEVMIGTPYVANAVVSGKVLDEIKGKKVTTSKFKAKVHYRRKIGFRPLYTKIQIETISTGEKGEKPAKKVLKSKKS